jgi:hypothetical protein
MDLLRRTLHAEFINENETLDNKVDNIKIAFQQWLLHQTHIALVAHNKELANAFFRNPSSEFEVAMNTLGISGETELLVDPFTDFQEPIWQNLSLIFQDELSGREIQLYWSVYGRNIFQQTWSDVCTNRSLFRTELGILGLGPRQAQPGDRIFILKGAAVPYMFRKSRVEGDSTAHELLGDVYMNGIMYGEIDESSITWEEIVVC